MKTLTLAGLALVIVVMALVSTTPKPAAAIDPTLDAALYAISQATARAEQIKSSQRATEAAVSSEATRQANIERAISLQATSQAFAVQSTAQAQNAQATQSTIDELTRQRAMTATADRAAIMATTTALAQSAQATATAEALNVQATRETYQAQATIQAVMIAAQATDTARLSATYATRQDRFTWGLLVIEILFVFGAAWVLWKLSGTLAAWAIKMRPPAAAEPTFAGLIEATAQSPGGSVVIEQEPEPAPRMPDVVTVVDNPAMVEALDRWAERYDARLAASEVGKHEAINGN